MALNKQSSLLGLNVSSKAWLLVVRTHFLALALQKLLDLHTKKQIMPDTKGLTKAWLPLVRDCTPTTATVETHH